MKLLLEYSNQLDLNPRDEVKNTPLHLACEDGHLEIIKLLCEAGADRGLENKDEKKPIELAKPNIAQAVAGFY